MRTRPLLPHPAQPGNTSEREEGVGRDGRVEPPTRHRDAARTLKVRVAAGKVDIQAARGCGAVDQALYELSRAVAVVTGKGEPAAARMVERNDVHACRGGRRESDRSWRHELEDLRIGP